MKKSLRFALLSAAFGLLPVSAFAETDCVKLMDTVKQAIAADSATTLSVVEKQVAASPNCACEIVKAAIEASKADAKLVVSIVETASTAAPQQMRLISQCAVAMAPDALAGVQSLMAKLEANSGESGKVVQRSSAKDAKGGPQLPPPVAANPLDFPGSGIGDPPVRVGGNPGGPGGRPFIPWGTFPNQPPGGVIPPGKPVPSSPVTSGTGGSTGGSTGPT